jgi:uncharacterized RDD family membrane protein YckC
MTDYVGFWARLFAMVIDSVLFAILLIPFFGLSAVRSGSFTASYLIPAFVIIGFWVWKGATPGKMLIGAKIVDANTGAKATLTQCALRYIGYFISGAVLMLGYIWIGIDSRKRGWHDMIAGTAVVRAR